MSFRQLFSRLGKLALTLHLGMRVCSIQGGNVSLQRKSWLLFVLLAALSSSMVYCPTVAQAQEGTVSRKVKSKVAPVYPELAKKMAISGTVKVAVVVGANGSVKSTKVLGGHPLLIDAAVDAVRKWKFEPGPDDSSGVIEFKFQPEN
jgi:TonB family protein